ncbi:PEBP-like protein [Penicillium hispanicum]|uniref:PEBP-like protein n=1 Tax=Penicillium hispanicum TaxID=1080232 RepID=UPI002541AA05|nr:PEBP-like protein [Penicillium hispanicum]KAJ5591915.1 PEBP-like protein [Penicillium hispanicum]
MWAFALATTAIAIASVASAGTLPSELAVIGEPSQVLNVTFQPSSSSLVEVFPGKSISADDTKNRPQPNLTESGSVIQHDQKYLFMMVDPDTNATDPASVGLHTVVANLSQSTSSSEDVLAKYIAPEPSGSSPHNYTLLLFKQPDGFAVPSLYNAAFALNLKNVLNRVNFPLQQFLNETGLDKPVAANWFQEGKSTTAATTASGTATATATNSATQTSTSNAAGRLGNAKELALAPVSVLGAMLMML